MLGGNVNTKHIVPSLGTGGVHFAITVTLGNTKYMLYGTPTTPSIPVIDALQILARIPKIYSTKSKMDIFVYTKFVSSSEFKSDSNAPIFSLI